MLIVGFVKVLFVKVSVELSVTTVPSIAKVTVDPVAEVLIPVPPVNVRLSLSRSMSILPESVVISKS